MERENNSQLSWAGAIVIAVLVTLFAFLGARMIASMRSRNTFGTYALVNLPNNESLEVVGDGFIYYDGGSLTRVNSQGQTVWSSLIGANAQFDAGVSGVAVWSGDQLTLVNWESGASESSSPMEADIISAKRGSKYAAVLLAPEHDGRIILLDTGGRQVDSIDMSGVTVLNYGFFSDDSLFWVMTLDTSGTVPTCVISTYNPGKRIVGSITDNEQLMYQVLFQSSQVCCAGVTHLKVYDYTGTENVNRRKLIYGWYLVTADEESLDPMMAYVLSAQYDAGVEMQDVRLIRSDVDEIVRMPFSCIALVAKDDRVYGFSSNGCIMIAQSGRKQVEAYPTGLTLDRVYGVTNNGVAVLGYGSQLYLVNLP